MGFKVADSCLCCCHTLLMWEAVAAPQPRRSLGLACYHTQHTPYPCGLPSLTHSPAAAALLTLTPAFNFVHCVFPFSHLCIASSSPGLRQLHPFLCGRACGFISFHITLATYHAPLATPPATKPATPPATPLQILPHACHWGGASCGPVASTQVHPALQKQCCWTPAMLWMTSANFVLLRACFAGSWLEAWHWWWLKPPRPTQGALSPECKRADDGQCNLISVGGRRACDRGLRHRLLVNAGAGSDRSSYL